MNRWGIPLWLEQEVRKRDKACVYCGVQMAKKKPLESSQKNIATWEHIINDASIITRENIALCCAACNSSKGNKKLVDWLRSNYCMNRGITVDTVAPVVKEVLNNSKNSTSTEKEP